MNIKRIVNLQPRNTLEVKVYPTDICNFDCTYCFPNVKDGIYRYPKNYNIYVRNFLKLLNFYNVHHNKEKFAITISGGGEPTLWPKLAFFCKEIKKKFIVETRLVTNASRTLKWWKNIYNVIDKVTISFHHEYSDVNHTIEVSDFLHKNGVSVNVMVLMDAEYFEHCKDIINQLQASKYAWFIEARPVVIFDGKDCNSYNTEQKKYMMTPLKRLPDANFLLKNINLFNPYESIAVYDDDSALGKTSSDYINNKENFFKDWICKVGDESIILQPSGNIVGSCGASIFNRDVNIFDDLFDNFVMSNNIKCPFNSCNCQPENHLSKWKF